MKPLIATLLLCAVAGYGQTAKRKTAAEDHVLEMRAALLAKESPARCAQEGFRSAGKLDETVKLSAEWIHALYCADVAIEYANALIKLHPELLEGKAIQ